MKRVAVTEGTGLIGLRIVAALRERGDEVTVLSRRPDHARRLLGVDALGWDPAAEPAPVGALEGRDAVVHPAGEPIAQRWSAATKARIRSSRVLGTSWLVRGLARTESRPSVLVGASAVGYYGARGDERLDEHAPSGTGFLSEVCEGWERAAAGAEKLGIGVVTVRTGVLLDRAGSPRHASPAARPLPVDGLVALTGEHLLLTKPC